MQTNCIIFVSFCVITVEQIVFILNLKKSKSKDYYGFSNLLIKEEGLHIVQPLTNCINLCLSEGGGGSFYTEISKITSMFKKAKLDNPSTYHPISLVPVIVFKYIIVEWLILYFDKSELFAKSQFGIRKGHSTEPLTVCIMESRCVSFSIMVFVGQLYNC